MFKKLKKIVYCLLICALLTVFCSCDYIISDSKPIESFVPQTVQTMTLVKPECQNDAVKPFFYENTPEENPVRPLETEEKIRDEYVRNSIVKNENELIETAMKGWKPVFYEGASLRLLYNEVLMVLNTIIQNDMTEYERVYAIYDYLSYYTVYDFELLDQYKEDESLVSNTDSAFTLNGVFFDGVAVCEGFSKAFSLMCSIEGIENVRITGEAGEDSLPHAWNKVKLDGVWYSVDSTNASLPDNAGTDEMQEYLNHAYFLISDSELDFTELTVISAFDKYTLADVEAKTNYGFYDKEYINGYTVVVSLLPLAYAPQNYIFNGKESLKAYISYLQSNDIKAAEFYSNLSTVDLNIALHTFSDLSLRIFYDNVYYIIF